MVLHILRALFVLLMAAVGWYYVGHPARPLGDYTWLTMAIALVVGILFLSIDILSPRRKLTVFSGTFFGLVVGVVIAYALSFVVRLLVEQFYRVPGMWPADDPTMMKFAERQAALETYLNLLIGVISCYISISFILQTKDDFRFIVPYVEFRKQTKGARPLVLDTNVLIDGRINDIASTGLLESQLLLPRFVLEELQTIADSSDKLKRNRGNRGLDVVAKLQGNPRVEMVIYETGHDEEAAVLEVDQRLTDLAKELGGRILTNDMNLNKVAQVRGVEVINLNELANALRPVVLPGEKMTVRLIKPGEEAGQGIGYLDDGTMVVVEQGRSHLNEDVELTVTSALQTSAGRMIFGRMGNGAAAAAAGAGTPPRRGRVKGNSHPPGSEAQSSTDQA